MVSPASVSNVSPVLVRAGDSPVVPALPPEPGTFVPPAPPPWAEAPARPPVTGGRGRLSARAAAGGGGDSPAGRSGAAVGRRGAAAARRGAAAGGMTSRSGR